jgi:hypothetical protein
VGRAGSAGKAARAGAELGRASGPLGPTARAACTTSGSAQLGTCRSGPACCAVMGCAPARGAFGTGPSCTSPGGGATRADLGIASRRVRGSRGTRLGCAGRAFVGRRATGCGATRSGCDRLGSGPRKLPASDAAGALVERAERAFFVGRPQDRGAGRPTGSVVVPASRFARRSARLGGAGPA